MKKDIVVIAHFCDDFDFIGNNRFNYLVNLLTEEDCFVELITSNFSHLRKQPRLYKEGMSSYKTTLLREPTYKRNISLRRFYSHYVLGQQLRKYLGTRAIPDIIYCAVPSLDLAYVASQFAQKHQIRLIIDIQDMWPEAFKMVFNIPGISHLIFLPMHIRAKKIYHRADELISVSQTYLDKIDHKETNKKQRVIYLGTDLSVFDNYVQNPDKDIDKLNEEIWLVYIGTLGNSYDLKTVIDAMSILGDKTNRLKFIVMGDGPLREKFQKYAIDKKVPVNFLGRVAYVEMVNILAHCDIAINPIKACSASSIVNKVCDYAAAGLPVLNTQECPEYRRLLESYDAGLNCLNEDAYDLSDKLYELYKDGDLRKRMGDNNRKMAKEKFNRNETYTEIINSFIS